MDVDDPDWALPTEANIVNIFNHHRSEYPPTIDRW
jgi:hypothetical protein